MNIINNSKTDFFIFLCAYSSLNVYLSDIWKSPRSGLITIVLRLTFRFWCFNWVLAWPLSLFYLVLYSCGASRKPNSPSWQQTSIWAPHTRSFTTPLRGEQRFQHSGFEWGDLCGLRPRRGSTGQARCILFFSRPQRSSQDSLLAHICRWFLSLYWPSWTLLQED